MILVVLFLVLFLGLWGQVARQIGSMIRIEEARARRVRRDAARLPAEAVLAQALAILEVGYPPSSSYRCSVQGFAITFEQDSVNKDEWNLTVSPTSETLTPLNSANFVATPPS